MLRENIQPIRAYTQHFVTYVSWYINGTDDNHERPSNLDSRIKPVP
jgi:hypothetical protein